MEKLPNEIIEKIFREMDYETTIKINKRLKNIFINRQEFFENLTVDFNLKNKDLIKFVPKRLKIICKKKILGTTFKKKLNLINTEKLKYLFLDIKSFKEFNTIFIDYLPKLKLSKLFINLSFGKSIDKKKYINNLEDFFLINAVKKLDLDLFIYCGNDNSFLIFDSIKKLLVIHQRKEMELDTSTSGFLQFSSLKEFDLSKIKNVIVYDRNYWIYAIEKFKHLNYIRHTVLGEKTLNRKRDFNIMSNKLKTCKIEFLNIEELNKNISEILNEFYNKKNIEELF